MIHLYETAAAIAGLRAELDGGAEATLTPRVEELASLLAQQQAAQAQAGQGTPFEQRLLRMIEALPMPAGVLDGAGKLRFANGDLLRLRRDNRISPQLAIDIAASEALAPLKEQALQGTIATVR